MSGIDRLLEIMARLRDPDGGCPWDLEQDFSTIAPHTIEEAYEVDDAIRRGDLDGLRGELGDLLFQVVFHAQMASEAGAFDFDDVARAICEKMVRRHPHVFADARVADADAQTRAWERHKDEERRERGEPPRASALDGVTLGLPALLRAQKLGRRAARAGFDWSRVADVLGKLREELAELEVEADRDSRAGVLEELGDLLFVATGVAQRFGVDAEEALRGANAKFERRFHEMESLLEASGKAATDLDAAEWLALWERSKRELRRGEP